MVGNSGLRGHTQRNQQDLIKNSMVEFVITCRLAFSRVGQTLAEAHKVIHLQSTGLRLEATAATEKLFCTSKLRYHALFLDEAIDIWTQRRVMEARTNGSIVGFSFTSDESPPSMNRFNGFRFQVTNVYFLLFQPEHVWDDAAYEDEYPFSRERHLTDVKHCPQKTGSGTMEVVESQFHSKGFSRYEAVSGTGDGGGENEGMHGVHALLECENDSYVRRRCFGHFAWRISANAQGVKQFEVMQTKTNALCTYVHDGISWSRLKCIACQSVEEGGLALVVEGTEQWQTLFGVDPPKIMDNRPECTLAFLEWVIHKQECLAQLIVHDFRTRDLKEHPLVEKTITDAKENALRWIDAVMYRKSLYLYYFAKSKEYITMDRTFEELADKAEKILWGVKVDEDVLQVVRLTWTDLDSLGWRPQVELSWVELCALLALGKDVAADMLEELDAYRFQVACTMAAYVKGTLDNFQKSMWTSAGILSKRPAQAKLSARLFRAHLQQLAPHAMTRYERHFYDDQTLMEQLEHFGNREPPVVVWRGKGRYAALFKFLAVRFLGQPDSVLSNEGVHAQWQSIANTLRKVSWKLLNALLKLHAYLQYFGALPDPEKDGLLQIIQEVRRGYWLQMKQLRLGGCPSGMRWAEMYKRRFNLCYTDISLLKASLGAYTGVGSTFESSRYNHIRDIFELHTFYRLSLLTARHYFYVAETKSFHGRAVPAEGESQGRPLVICWFEPLEETIDGTLLAPVTGAGGGVALKLSLCSIAEIARASGDFRTVPENCSKRGEEIMLEESFLSHGLVTYQSRQLGGDLEDQWKFVVSSEQDAEDNFFLNTPVSDLTKFQLARTLQLRENLTEQQCRILWNRWSKAPLVALLQSPPVPAAPGPAAAALAKGLGI